ncbi:flavin reductase family protein [Pseudonocardia nigra]|uniref:flavin reductase family protein n=1 Tax=Pseudonocardia nigra TaxID=1921578 RepID=UPI0027E25883|nr:iron-sulfur cluster-binding domain-containing protein [Pseudonocardia nigra]
MVAAAKAAGADWRLPYGGRRRGSMAYVDALTDPRVTVRTPGRARLRAALREMPHAVDVYACGPEPLLAALERLCPAGRLHVERFVPRPDAATRAEEHLEVRLARSRRTVAVPAGTSVLDAVVAARVDVLGSCREGTCGTCETAVLDGEPDHRDSVLDAAERAADDTMMICVSRARGPRLVLDP